MAYYSAFFIVSIGKAKHESRMVVDLSLDI